MNPLVYSPLILLATTSAMAQNFEVQGHRGARGLVPENTIPSFEKAVELGVHTVEMDVVISDDRRVVVSHEAWMNHVICIAPDGRPITAGEQTQHNIFRMSYDEIARYDCGSLGHPQFPEQQPMPAVKPLMADAIRAVDAHTERLGRTPAGFNIELKSRPDWDRVFNPDPETFSQLVYDELDSLDVLDRVTIQSFDARILQAMREIDPVVPLALLVDNIRGLGVNLRRLGFTPEIYSPNYRLVTRGMVRAAHARGMRVIPWTVNRVRTVQRMQRLGVDGLITDYPDRAAFLLE